MPKPKKTVTVPKQIRLPQSALTYADFYFNPNKPDLKSPIELTTSAIKGSDDIDLLMSNLATLYACLDFLKRAGYTMFEPVDRKTGTLTLIKNNIKE
jgi:hypothetical protein